MTQKRYLVVDDVAIGKGQQPPVLGESATFLEEDAHDEDIAVASQLLCVLLGGFHEALAAGQVHFQFIFDKLELALSCSINRLFITKSRSGITAAAI